MRPRAEISPSAPRLLRTHIDPEKIGLLIGPYVRRGHIDHTRYSIPSVLRTVEVLFGLEPLNIYDAMATPMLDALAAQPAVARYDMVPSNIAMARNPGQPKSTSFMLDGPDSLRIPNEEWASIKGRSSLLEHLAYLNKLGMVVAADADAR